MQATNVLRASKKSIRFALPALWLGAAVAATSPPSDVRQEGCSQLRYDAVPFMPPEGAVLTSAILNNRGQIAGLAIAELSQVYVWAGGEYTYLQEPPISQEWAFFSGVTGFNDRMQIVGYRRLSEATGFEGFLVDRQGVTTLTEQPGFYLPVDINNRGEVIGGVNDPAYPDMQAGVWRRGQVTRLPPLTGHPSAFPSAINDRGVVVGISNPLDGTSYAVMWKPPYNSVQRLPMPPSPSQNPYVSELNNKNDVVFNVFAPDGVNTLAYLWTDRKLRALPPLPGYAFSAVWDINDHGLAAGSSTDTTGDHAATIWRGGQACKLADLIVTPGFTGELTEVQELNNRGEMLATSYLLRPARKQH